MRRPLLGWVGAIAMLAGAWVLGVNLPSPTARTDAHIVPGSAGERIEARTFAITVDDVVVTDGVRQDDYLPWDADGTWLVADVSVEALGHENDAQVDYVRMLAGDRVFLATRRAPATLRDVMPTNDMPTHASVAFQIPDDLTGTVRLQFGAALTYPLLDSLVEVPIDLGTIVRERDRALLVPEITVEGP